MSLQAQRPAKSFGQRVPKRSVDAPRVQLQQPESRAELPGASPGAANNTFRTAIIGIAALALCFVMLPMLLASSLLRGLFNRSSATAAPPRTAPVVAGIPAAQPQAQSPTQAPKTTISRGGFGGTVDDKDDDRAGG